MHQSESQHTVFVVVLTVPQEDSVEEAYVVQSYSLGAGKGAVKGGSLCGCKLQGCWDCKLRVVGVIQWCLLR